MAIKAPKESELLNRFITEMPRPLSFEVGRSLIYRELKDEEGSEQVL